MEMHKDTDQWLQFYNQEGRTEEVIAMVILDADSNVQERKDLAKERDVTNLFAQSTAFRLSGKAEIGSYRACPDESENGQTNENEEAAA